MMPMEWCGLALLHDPWFQRCPRLAICKISGPAWGLKRWVTGLFALAAIAMPGCGGAGSPSPHTIIVSPVAPSAIPIGVHPSPLPPASSPGISFEPSPSASPFALPQSPPPTTGHPLLSLYAAQLHGYDASYPQCAAGRPTSLATFAVIGVNSGKAFSTNPCLSRLWREAPSARALYVNSGLNPGNYPKATADCQELGGRVAGTADEKRAYAIGCGEAVYSVAAALSAGASNAEMWWVDVESSNSWSDRDLNLNRYSLQGEVDQLVALARPVGIYSTFRDWSTITGDWRPDVAMADWVAGGVPADACAALGFSGGPVWLAQEAATWTETPAYDSDWAC